METIISKSTPEELAAVSFVIPQNPERKMNFKIGDLIGPKNPDDGCLQRIIAIQNSPEFGPEYIMQQACSMTYFSGFTCKTPRIDKFYIKLN
jgi:hypothetical protein